MDIKPNRYKVKQIIVYRQKLVCQLWKYSGLGHHTCNGMRDAKKLTNVMFYKAKLIIKIMTTKKTKQLENASKLTRVNWSQEEKIR